MRAHAGRTCGDMFCSDCTLKMQVPAGFEKKGKQGPSRVCHECRHRLVDGATLIDAPYVDSSLPPPPPPPPAGPTPAASGAGAGRSQARVRNEAMIATRNSALC